MTTTPHTSASLHYREGSSDKVYHAAIEPKGDDYHVTFSYGRRGNTLTTGTKTTRPVPLEEAQRIFDKLVKSKLAKGYHFTAMPGASSPYPQNGNEGRDTGIRCQLLNPANPDDVPRLLSSAQHCLQEKHDGRRLMVRKQGDAITGINRRGLAIAIPQPIRDAVAAIPHDVLIDGEAVGDILHAFDLLEASGRDLRQEGYLKRFTTLMRIVPDDTPALRWTETHLHPDAKRIAYQRLKDSGAEGVVCKEIDAPWSAGRPASGGSQLKHKFVETASFVVTSRNECRSVALGLYAADGRLIAAGNVTVPPGIPIPATGQVVEVRYLYAFPESGSVYQPVLLTLRNDIPPDDCTVDQLKYKPAA